jgi:hypothetical protein
MPIERIVQGVKTVNVKNSDKFYGCTIETFVYTQQLIKDQKQDNIVLTLPEWVIQQGVLTQEVALFHLC